MASRRLKQMDKNLIDKLLLVAFDSVHYARVLSSNDLNEISLKLIEDGALDLVASVRNYRMKQRSPIFSEGQKA